MKPDGEYIRADAQPVRGKTVIAGPALQVGTERHAGATIAFGADSQ